ncbi:probable methyltransferase-like protein 15 isoform X2 [Lontra canadensis]|uniref:probable methyltransferase-like protein 15 isoform X2 n=1 Tax=Lontra canadensis TaxID=76717 RepID=UPI0013F2BEFE|nr:probable methyltransferase-like protein 15 isoform X2 [Lontra canadensis]
MLRYPYFCRIYKEFLSCWLESGIFNLGVWPNKIHDTAQRNNEYEAQEQTDQTGTQEKHRSQDRDFEAIAKLHIPVMVDEVVHCLAPQKGQIFLDMTFGSGGHTRAILQKESDIALYALDRDPAAYAIAEQLSELYPKQIRAMLGQFSQAEALLMKAGVQPGTLDGVLLDLGCSSMQLDAPERGFSLRKDGPLDMRMDGGRSTGTCIHPENIRGGEACQENRFSNRSGTQPLPHLQNPAACQHRCRPGVIQGASRYIHQNHDCGLIPTITCPQPNSVICDKLIASSQAALPLGIMRLLEKKEKSFFCCLGTYKVYLSTVTNNSLCLSLYLKSSFSSKFFVNLERNKVQNK